MKTPSDLKILQIKEGADLILDEDKVELKANYFRDCVGGLPSGSSFLFTGDFGTKARTTCPPIRPNAYVAVTGTASASGLIRLTTTTTGISNGDTIYVDEVVGTVEANGVWVVSNVTGTTLDLVGSAYVHAYISGGIATKTPITIESGKTFYDKDTQLEYEIVAGRDSSNNLRLYVYDSASTEASKWIELTRYFTSVAGGTPSATAKTVSLISILENAVAFTLSTNTVQYWIAYNLIKGTTAFILSSTSTVLTTDTVLGANGLGWAVGDTIYIYRFPAIAFNYTFANGATPSIDWLPVIDQRKMIFLYQATDGTKHQALQIMRRNARNYFYDSSSSTYLRTLPAGWYIESDFGILNPFATTYGSITSPKSPTGGFFSQRAVAGASNASPIVITTTAASLGLSTGDIVVITGVEGNTAANGTFTITVLTSTTFQLDGSTGNGAWTTGGLITPYRNIAHIYDKTGGRNWLNLYASLTNGSNAFSTGQIILGSLSAGDAVGFGYNGVGWIYQYGTLDVPARKFGSTEDLISLLTLDFGTDFTFTGTNATATVTITAKNVGSKYNGALLILTAFVGSITISNASQGGTQAPLAQRYLEGGNDTTAVYSQSRVYVTGTYGGYEESDPILQGFLQGDSSTQPPDLLLTPVFSFALMNKELTHLNLYAAFQNTTVVAAGWKDATKEYLLHFELPIQSATTDTGYFATEWTDQGAVLKNLQPVYSYDISQTNKMEANATIYDAKKTAGADNINNILNHAVDMVRTYPTPRFATEATRNDGALILIDDGDTQGRLSNYSGAGDHEDDNFPDVRLDNNNNKLKIQFRGTGEILGLEILNDIIYVLRKSTIELYDLQGVFIRTYKADVCAKKSILATPYGIVYGGTASIFIIPIDGSAIVSLNPLWDNYYSGNQFVTGTTQYVSSTYRNDMIFGYNELYKELWCRIKVNTATSTEIRCYRYSFERGTWSVRILNVTADIKYFSKNIGDATFTIGTASSILQYPNRSGSNIYQDDVRINGSSLEISQSLNIPRDFDMNIAAFNAKIAENSLHGFSMDIVGASSDGYGMATLEFFANRETVAFDTHYVRVDEKVPYREINKRGGIERLSVKVSVASTSTVTKFDVAELDLGFLPNRNVKNL